MDEPKQPIVSIVTINYNQAGVTNELLASLNNISYPNFEVLIVDNNSANNNAELIDTSYPFVTLIKSDTNSGFSGGNNLGIKAATGEYILLLNNDTEVEKGFLEPMVDLLQKNPSIGAISPKIRYFFEPETIQYAGFSEMNPYRLQMHSIGFQEKDHQQHNTVRKTHSAHGCAMMVPRSVIENVGLMPELFFLYYEEHDWSASILRAGYSIYYQPNSLVLHKESVSVEKESTLQTYYLNRNRILYMRRNIFGLKRIISILYTLFYSIPGNLARFVLKRNWKHLKVYLKAITWHLWHFKVRTRYPLQ